MPAHDPPGDADPSTDAPTGDDTSAATDSESATATDVHGGATGEAAGAGFADLGLSEPLVAALARLGYEEPTPIQREAIPVLLDGRDLMGQAATGTGKTAAFALPALDGLAPLARRPDSPTVLVLVPTRELAVQVSEAAHRYGRAVEARVLPVYGGQAIGHQIRGLRRGVDVVVATPGRAVDLLNRGALDLHAVGVVVLDEADEMLDMGFADDIDAILGSVPETRQTVLFSATLPARIEGIARRHLVDAARIALDDRRTESSSRPSIRQTAYMVHRAHKPTALGRLLDVEAPEAALVFCRTRAEVDSLTETLSGRGYRAEALHGGFGQEQRDRVVQRLRSGTADLVVATDVAARGLDVDILTHVVNYDVPSSPETYLHRIGRVGRAGRTGVALTLAQPREHRMLRTIGRVTGQKIDIGRVPSIDETRAHRLASTQAAIEEALGDDDRERVRAVVESLADEHDLMEVTLAAVALVHEMRAREGDDGDDQEIPAVAEQRRRDRDDRRDNRRRDERDQRGPRGRDRDRGRGPGDRDDRRGRWDRDERRDRPTRDRDDRGRSRGDDRPTPEGVTRVFVNAGREQRVGPGDLVGAIANETHLDGRDIGAITVRDRFSLVEVPSEAVDEVIDALRGTTLRGRRVNARRERY